MTNCLRVKGFSERNIKRMLTFYREYPDPSDVLSETAAALSSPKKVPQPAAQIRELAKVPRAAAQLPMTLLWSIPWYHHIILIEKIKDLTARLWYMQQTLANGWSRNVLLLMVKSEAHRRGGKDPDELRPTPPCSSV